MSSKIQQIRDPTPSLSISQMMKAVVTRASGKYVVHNRRQDAFRNDSLLHAHENRQLESVDSALKGVHSN